MEKEKFNCPGCGHEVIMNTHEFVDVSTDPQYKETIRNGEFFMFKCPQCGEKTMVQYPMMYMDPEKKLNIYFAPDHEEELLEQLNSLELPEADIDETAVFRVVSHGAKLLEKILIYDAGRDDRIVELLKALVLDRMREEWPDLQRDDLLYFKEDDEEYFLVWSYINANDEQLTVEFGEDFYDRLCDEYLDKLVIPPGKYAEVDENWIDEKVNLE